MPVGLLGGGGYFGVFSMQHCNALRCLLGVVAAAMLCPANPAVGQKVCKDQPGGRPPIPCADGFCAGGCLGCPPDCYRCLSNCAYCERVFPAPGA